MVCAGESPNGRPVAIFAFRDFNFYTVRSPFGVSLVLSVLPRFGGKSAPCSNMGSVYHPYPNTIGGLKELRGELNDPDGDVWAQAGGVGRFKLLDVVVINRGAKFGTRFESRRGPARGGRCFRSFAPMPVYASWLFRGFSARERSREY